MTTEHDLVRFQQAQSCDMDDVECVIDAIRAIQSTDDSDPAFAEIHDRLQERLRSLEQKGCE